MKIKCKNILIIVSLLFAFKIQANIALPGLIPLYHNGQVAFDLFDAELNRVLLPFEVLRKVDAGEDISTLNPKESEIYKNTKNDDEVIDFKVNEGKITYESEVISRIGNFRFVVNHELNNSSFSKTFLISKKVHNVLLRQALLKKLGYSIPSIQHVKKVRVNFSSRFERENFVNELASATLGDPKRWVIAEGEKHIILQDLVVMSSDNHIYNLAMGYIPSSVIAGRRVLNSLLIPYSLVEVPESANMFSWVSGRILSNNVKHEYEESSEFNTSFEDALWVVNKILKLKPKDFLDIAKAGNYPKEVELLVYEKLKARRNSLISLYELNAPKLKVKGKVSRGEHLKKGKLLKENWEGYGSRFSYGDPDSPLSSTEIFSYFKSQAFSLAFSAVIDQINDKVLPKTDVADQYQQKVMQKLFEHILTDTLNGTQTKFPATMITVPWVAGNVIASRDIVAGSYLGTDNKVQLVDVVGASVSAGAYFSSFGLPTPLTVSGNASAYYTRTYSHIKPIFSIKAALKTPFKNMLVPMIKRKFGKFFDPLSMGLVENLDDEELNEQVDESLLKFNEALSVGESIIITDYYGAGVGASAGVTYLEVLKAQAGFNNSNLVLSRTHIHKKDENTIQIYRDRGLSTGLTLYATFSAVMPIITVSVPNTKIKTKSKFFELNLENDLDREGKIVNNLQALREVLMKNNFDTLKHFQTPYVLEHAVVDNTFDLDFLLFEFKKKSVKDVIKLTHPAGDEKYFYKRIIGKRTGIDFLKLTEDAINGVVSQFTDISDVVNVASNGNPGDSFLGKSVTRSVTYESEIEPINLKRREARVVEPFLNLEYKWKGWEMKQSRLYSLIDDLNDKYDYNFYDKSQLSQTSSLQLYTILLQFFFYEDALLNLANLSKAEITTLVFKYVDYTKYHKYWAKEGFNVADLDKHFKEKEVKKYLKVQKNYKKYLAKNKLDKITFYAEKLASKMELLLPVKELVRICGGEENIFISSKMIGFRKNDEAGDSMLLSNTVGQIGSKYYAGPISHYKNLTGMTDAEFFISWFLEVL